MERTNHIHKGALFWEQWRNHTYWVKRDALILQNCNTPECYNAKQIDAFSAWFIKGDFARKVVKVWLRDCQDERIATDSGNTLGLPNLPGFEEHRHDQSAITNILRSNRWGYAPYSDSKDVLYQIFKHDRWRF